MKNYRPVTLAEPLACSARHGGMRFVACIAQTTVIDQLLRPLNDINNAARSRVTYDWRGVILHLVPAYQPNETRAP